MGWPILGALLNLVGSLEFMTGLGAAYLRAYYISQGDMPTMRSPEPFDDWMSLNSIVVFLVVGVVAIASGMATFKRRFWPAAVAIILQFLGGILIS